MYPLTEPPKLKKQEKHSIEVVVDRLVNRESAPSSGSPTRSRPALRPGRRCGHPGFRRPRRGRPVARAALLGAAGLPERPSAGARRAGAAVVLVQLAVRRLPGLHRAGHPQGGRPRAGRAGRRRGRWPGARSTPGRRAPPASTSPGCCRASPRSWASPWTPRGTSCRRRPARPSCTASNEQVHISYRNRYGRQRSYYAEFEGVIPFLERRAAADRLRVRRGRSTRATCGRCRARPARAPGSSRRSWP